MSLSFSFRGLKWFVEEKGWGEGCWKKKISLVSKPLPWEDKLVTPFVYLQGYTSLQALRRTELKTYKERRWLSKIIFCEPCVIDKRKRIGREMFPLNSKYSRFNVSPPFSRVFIKPFLINNDPPGEVLSGERRNLFLNF